MATKAQKRAANALKHQKFMEAYRAEGLRALREEQARRKREALREWQNVHDKKHHKFVNECPHCQDIKRNHKRNSRAS